MMKWFAVRDKRVDVGTVRTTYSKPWQREGKIKMQDFVSLETLSVTWAPRLHRPRDILIGRSIVEGNVTAESRSKVKNVASIPPDLGEDEM